MAYLRRWRECHSAVLAIGRTSQATRSSDDNDSGDSNNVQHSEQREPAETSSNAIDSSEMSYNSLSEAVSSSVSESSGNEYEVVTEKDLEGDLREWSVESQISKSSIDKLLTILRKNGHQELPKDSRTLLQTPRDVPVYDKCGGKYVYLGIKESLEKRVQTDAGKFSSQLNLTFNIDGVPVFKSSNTQFWPILCLLQNCKPFIVALFYGSSKPSNLSEFLDDFTNEASELINSGIRIGDILYSVNIRAFVCDAPARAFVKNIKSHTGYNSCERCEIKGYWKDNRVIFHSDRQFPKRLDNQFSNYGYNLHQTGETPLINCGVSCVQDFPLDYMHLVCLGVVKRLLSFLKQGPSCCKLSNNLLSQASEKLMDLSGKLPSEFARQPRPLTFMDRWKATEFRQFLLYTGPVVLKKILSKEKYTHFLTFSVGISILLESDAAKRNGYLDYAEQLLCFFVDTCKEHYSEKFVVYNVHNLKHITDDSRYFGCSLNDLSGFPFENYLKTVKGLVRNSRNPVSQVAKRLKESEVNQDYFTENTDYKYISTKQRNSCFLLYDESFVFIREKQDDNNYVCNIVSQEQTDDFFSAPCSSKLLNIVFLRRTRRMKRKVVENYKDAEEYDCTTTAETGEDSEGEDIGKRKPKKRQFDDFITDKVLPSSQMISKSASKTQTEITTEDRRPINLPEPPSKVPPVGRIASTTHGIHAVTETAKPMSSRMRSRSPNDDMPTVSQLLGSSQDSLFSNQASRSPSVEQTSSTSRSVSRSPIINNCDRISLISYGSFFDRIRSCRTSSPSLPPSENRSLRSPSLSPQKSSLSYKNRSHRSRSPLTQESSTSYENRSHKSVSHSTQRCSSGYNKNGSHRSSSPSTQRSGSYNKNRFISSPSLSTQINNSLFNKNRSNRSPSHTTRRSSPSDENRSRSRSVQRSSPYNNNRSPSHSAKRSSPFNKNKTNRSPSHSTQRSSLFDKKSNRSPSPSTQRSNLFNKNRCNRSPSHTTRRSSPSYENRSRSRSVQRSSPYNYNRSPSHSAKRSSPFNKNKSNRSPSHSTQRSSLFNKKSNRSPSPSTQISSLFNKNKSNRSSSNTTQRSSPCNKNKSNRSPSHSTKRNTLFNKNGSNRLLSHSTLRGSPGNENRFNRSLSYSTQRSSPCNRNKSIRSPAHLTQRSSPGNENRSHRSLFSTQSRLPNKNGSYRSNLSHTSTRRSRSRDRSPDDTGFPMSTAKFQKRVLHMLVDIRKELQAQQKVQCVEGFAISRAETLDEFVQLESSSKIAEDRKAMVDVLSKVGGGNIRDNVKKIMGKLMTNELMSKFNMKGGKDKMAFRNTSLMGVVTASVLKTPSMEMHTEQDITKAMAHCLKYAPDRRGGGGRGKYDADRQATA